MEITYYKNLDISTDTEKRRQQIKSLQDEFMTFSWRGFDAFDNFGAFIINEKKGSLKFYNGLDFTNEYSKPQFDSNIGELMGVNFNRQKIDFTIGVYWISIEHYRLLLDWLNPMEVNMLSFGFNRFYGYMAKLTKIADSTRYIVGRENGIPMYYTELKLSFELQGAQCAKGLFPYELIQKTEEPNSLRINTGISEFIYSDLSTPIEIGFEITPDSADANFSYNAKYNGETIELFSVTFAKLTKDQTFYLKYNSETGVLYIRYGNSNAEKILSLITTTDTGERIVQQWSTKKFVIPGRFEDPYFDMEGLVFTGEAKNLKYKCNSFMCFPRTNII